MLLKNVEGLGDHDFILDNKDYTIAHDKAGLAPRFGLVQLIAR